MTLRLSAPIEHLPPMVCNPPCERCRGHIEQSDRERFAEHVQALHYLSERARTRGPLNLEDAEDADAHLAHLENLIEAAYAMGCPLDAIASAMGTSPAVLIAHLTSAAPLYRDLAQGPCPYDHPDYPCTVRTLHMH